jgi:hypothetical protein
MSDSYDLTRLDANSFEHMINLLALRALGLGATGFGPGSDGGRDGYFEGESPYPSEAERWSGRWYIQSKFHKPHLSKDPQKWLLERIQEELNEFKNPESKRRWPDNWIVATNIDPSGAPDTGSFDKAREMVVNARPELESRFHIWGGRKIIDLLALNPEVAEHYGDFLAPGNVFSTLYNQLSDARAEIETVLHFLIARQFKEQQYTKLEQAGSAVDTRPGIHRLFVDLPFRASEYDIEGLVVQALARAAAKSHRIDTKQMDTKDWRHWNRHPARSRVWFVKGGPGQGKSTVGQYFCQIQRAALILLEDKFPVLPQQRRIASEVKEVAEKVGLWPQSPRIPISIELKAFAQWLGSRTSDLPRGVLSYLAERIGSGVEQKVEAGTLKRALRARSWFVAFDGLDEVPHDVKEAVAMEVCRFINDVAVENNADLMAYCSSRPQGYSGQFFELDCLTIDLLNLSPEQALQCAQPVLEIDRTEDESKRSLAILESATKSLSVRELMTTPLQSHIMAVVIRDGGRPPDRRWLLFSRFYQVIKTREANRNLLEPRLAKLLREEDQLLKTVHNRLGFVLHARAETSKGAQTHLEREEFRALVTEAVSQMMESDVSDTVETIMEATLDRLVLVSSPEDSKNVRFDIRPLQEFFAAEFLYESVTAERLRARLETIAGDPHWREVMHFLMSALVENGRGTELAVAIDVLECLNEGTEEGDARLLNRRLGRGAILAARLLQEGVLEQDKRVRQQFRKCLEPMAAFVELDELLPLMTVEQPNSRAWLINFMVEALRESQPAESIGAAIGLTYILPDDSEHVEQVKKILLESPPEFVSFALASRDFYSDVETSEPVFSLSNWLIDVALELILRPEWHLLTAGGMRAAIYALRREKETSSALAKDRSLPETHMELLECLLEKPLIEDYLSDSGEDFGIVESNYFLHDWTTNSFAFRSWINELPESASTSLGMLQFIYRVLRYGKTKKPFDLLSLLNYVDEWESRIFDLPQYIRAYIPLNTYFPIDDQVKLLKSLSEEQIETLLVKKQMGSHLLTRPLYINWLKGGRYTIPQWERLVSHAPSRAIESLYSPFSKQLLSRLKDREKEEGLNILIDKLVEYPTILREYSYCWGDMLSEAPARESDLRNAFFAASSGPVKSRRSLGRRHSFKLNLPSEASLLPHLIRPIIQSNTGAWVKLENQELKEWEQIVKEFVSDNRMLEQIINDCEQPSSHRAAALLMSLLHPDGDRDLGNKKQMLIEFYSPDIATWYLNGVETCLRLLATERDPAARAIVGGLLDAARTDYEGRNELQEVLKSWRETSYAPVQSAGVLEKWLTGK